MYAWESSPLVYLVGVNEGYLRKSNRNLNSRHLKSLSLLNYIQDRKTPLFTAIAHHNMDAVNFLIAQKAEVDAKDEVDVC